MSVRYLEAGQALDVLFELPRHRGADRRTHLADGVDEVLGRGRLEAALQRALPNGRNLV
jgi:hypothetical protein